MIEPDNISTITVNNLVDNDYEIDCYDVDEEFYNTIEKIENMKINYEDIDDTLSIVSEKTEIFDMSEDDEMEMEMLVYELIGDYMESNINTLSNIDYDAVMIDNITEIIYEYCKETKICEEGEEYIIHEYVEKMIYRFFDSNPDIIPRSYKTSFITELSETVEELDIKIKALQNVYQPQQKSEEWYETRHNIISASSLWKVFSSESVQNSLIYEKCKPYAHDYRKDYENVLSSLHWGNKYEPLTIMIYEKMYETKIGSFGCIIHPKYPFIGASPDGINIDNNNPRYGRMLEVKNIFNREITGIPKEEYWIQMQIQMETCDLEECDFIETRFKEYETEEEFYNDEYDTTKQRGVILYFVERIHNLKTINNNPHYVYMPLNIPLQKENIDNWITNTKEELKDTHIIFKAQYWWLDQLSCILVKRNRDWFEWSIIKIQEIWNIILNEKQTGYDHRAPKKKEVLLPEVVHTENNNTQIIKNLEYNKGLCLVRLDENGIPI
jgi:putative phage-type endonuclease